MGNMNSTRINKAMILAAGLGTRLKPITDSTPKPMIQVGSLPLIGHVLKQISAAGISDVIINLHHLPQIIQDFVGNGSKYNLRVQYSYEPQILGTGGGIEKCADFFESNDFLLMNADVLCDINLKLLIDEHIADSDRAATMVVKKLITGEKHTPLTISKDFNITNIGDESGKHHYTGIMIGTSKVIDTLPKQTSSCLIKNSIVPLIKNGEKIAAYDYEGYWNDVGTHERLEAARKDII